MKTILLLSLLILPQAAFGLDLINNTKYPVTVTVNGNSGTLKPQAIVDYRPPKMKAPLYLSASGRTNGGKPFSCKKTIHDIYDTVTIPEDCR